MLSREQIEALIPHQGRMCLWDEVVAWNERSIRLRARSHVDPDHPLRSHDQLRAVHLCEYGAQAMAVHGGLRAHESGEPARPGLLVALRSVHLHCTEIDGLSGWIECAAEVLVEGESSQQYNFHISHDGKLLAEGRAAVMLQPV